MGSPVLSVQTTPPLSFPPSPAATKGWRITLGICLALSLVAALRPSSPSALPPEALAAINTGDTAWMLTATALVLLMTPGLSFFYGGMVSRKSVLSTMLQSFIAMGVISLVWVVAGFSLAFGESIQGVIGNPLTYLLFDQVGGAPNAAFAPTIPLVLFALFQLKFAIITPALITGAFAERVRFSAYVLFMVLFSLLIYAPLAHWTWHPRGFLRNWGVLDFAGGTVVHMAGGIAALAAALFLGPRTTYERGTQVTPTHLPYVLLGTGMLWFGWFGFNAGSALGASPLASLAFLTTNTASAAAMLTWMAFDGACGRKPSCFGACIGAVVGLVAITPAAGFVSVGASMCIGAITAIVCNITAHWRTKTSLDDTLDVFPCHGMGGICGMLLTAVFATDNGLITGNTATMIAHLKGLAVVAPFIFCATWFLLKATNYLIPLRVSKAEELAGLDQSQHGERLS